MSKFQEYILKLECLDIKRSLIKKKKLAIFLSGSSDYCTSALSLIQEDFMQIFKEFSYEVIDSNFPYHMDFEYQKKTNPKLSKAVWNNIIYYIHTIFNKRYQYLLYQHMKALNQTEDLIIVCLSSGLNMLCECIAYLELPKNTMIIALGPVAFRKFPMKKEKLYVIKGKQDIYSLYLDRHRMDYTLFCGHHDYMIHPKVREIIYSILLKNKKNRERL